MIPKLSGNRVLLLLATLALGGCYNDPWDPTDELPRVPVAGTVTLDGAPLAEGMIQFDPMAETAGTTAAAEIVGGKYAIAKTQGPAPGKHKVRISGRAPVKLGPGEAPGGTPRRKPEPVPAKYNNQSTLETEIPEGGSEALDFTLKSS